MFSFVFYSCQKDEFTERKDNGKPSNQLNVKKLNGKQISSNQNLLNDLKEVIALKNQLSPQQGARLVYDNQYEVWIDTTFATYIEDPERHISSYNFLIKTDTFENPFVENLLMLYKDGIYEQSYIVQYGFTEEELMNFREESPPQTETTIIPFEYNQYIATETENKCSAVLICNDLIDYTSGTPHNGQLHGISADGTCMVSSCSYQSSGWYISGWQCNYATSCGGGDGGDPTGPDDGGDGGGSGGDGDDNPGDNWDPTDPNNHGNGGIIGAPTIVLNPEPEENFDENCEELNKLIASNPNNNPYVDGVDKKKPRLALINIDDNLNSNFEHGYALDNIGNYPSYGSLATLQPPSTDNHVYFPVRAYRYGTIHTHPDHKPWIPMFSADDMYSLVRFKENYSLGNPAGDALFVSILVVRQGYDTMTYAIKIEDPDKLDNLNNYRNTEDDDIKWERFELYIQDYYEENANGMNGSATQYQKAFLSLVEELDLGISLYKMNNYDPRTNQMETWENLTLKEDGNAQAIPCNN